MVLVDGPVDRRLTRPNRKRSVRPLTDDRPELLTIDHRLDRFRLRGEVERPQLQGRIERRVRALFLGISHALRHPDRVDIAASEHLDDALVESEVADWMLNLSAFDIPHAVARETGHRGRARIDIADVPEPADQQRAVRRANHVVDARGAAARLQNHLLRAWRGGSILLAGLITRVDERFEHTAAYQVENLRRQPVLRRFGARELLTPGVAQDVDPLV